MIRRVAARSSALVAPAMIVWVGALSAAAGAHVLRVGTYHGMRGQYRSIQAAVNAARPGDWILIAPGDYKTTRVHTPRGAPEFPAAVVITTPRIHIRGMNRNTVIVDGTRPGSAVCSRRRAVQNFGLRGGARGGIYGGPPGRGPSGVNGLMVYRADGVTIENLTACNFLAGSRDAGNQVWFNGGADSGRVGGHGFRGDYLTSTSTFYDGETSAATYGEFSSDWSGGTFDQVYASNFNDSGIYIGACQQVCDQTLNHAWSQYNALGYSGTNSGGRLLIENSQFDHNEDGFDTNSQNADEPAPQNGSCPRGVRPPVRGAPTCWVFYRNNVHDNNNPNVPSAGSAAAGPVGTGMSVSGGRYDTIMDNRFSHNNAWGMILVPYLDSGAPCFAGMVGVLGPGSCLWDDYGDALIGNVFSHNGAYGHPTNGDFAQINFVADPTANCYRANHQPGGRPVSPPSAAAAQAASPRCGGPAAAPSSTDPRFLGEVLCDSQTEIVPGTPATCPTGQYPRRRRVIMHPLPRHLPTMPRPCSGVPVNPWCPVPSGRG